MPVAPFYYVTKQEGSDMYWGTRDLEYAVRFEETEAKELLAGLSVKHEMVPEYLAIFDSVFLA